MPTLAADAAPEVDEIVRQTEQAAYYQGKDGHARVLMTITDARGRERKRDLSILRWDEEDAARESDRRATQQKYYVYLHYPGDVKDTVLLVWKHPRKDDDRWYYLPALDLVKRIAAGDKRTSFLGSDFFYEDISGRGIEEDTHKVEKVSDNYYVLRNTPREPGNVEFSSYRMWIHRDSFIPVKVEFYDKQNEKYRVYDALKVETIQGYPTVVESRMRNLQTNRETTLKFRQVSYDIGLDESIFSERYLRQPPGQLFR